VTSGRINRNLAHYYCNWQVNQNSPTHVNRQIQESARYF